MSVPLPPNPNPLYPLPDWTLIAKSGGENATLDLKECHCGCCMYEHDDEKD